nr:hypothetical protein [Mycoplasmopsis bovis]
MVKFQQQPVANKKELNLISWNGGEAKYDIRDWNNDHSRSKQGNYSYFGRVKKFKRFTNNWIGW